MNETIEELEDRYFNLQMKDIWNSSDYRYADELKEKIKKLEGEKENDKKTSRNAKSRK